MQVVGRLVGLDADEAALDVVEGEEPVVQRDVVERAGEHLLGAREEVLPERPAAADLVLPQPRLRLVDAERTGGAERRAEVFGGEALFVDAVARFVEDAEKSLVELAEGVS